MGSKGSKSRSKKRAKSYITPLYLHNFNSITPIMPTPLPAVNVPLVSPPLSWVAQPPFRPNLVPNLVPTAWPQSCCSSLPRLSIPSALPSAPPCLPPPPLPPPPLPATSYCYDRRYETLFPEYECDGYSPPPPRRRCKELIVCEDIYC